MPRTKINRNVGNSKRARDNTAEIEEILREFEIEAENSIQMLQMEHNRALRDVDNTFEELVKSIPPRILSMKIKDVMKLRDFNDVIIDEKMSNLNVTVKENAQRADEEEASQITSGSEGGVGQISILGSLKTRRRSKSTSSMASNFKPGPRTMMSAAKGRTPIVQHQPAQHESRSKYRTPLSNFTRQKAASADRIATIIPKANPSHPFSMLRHARAGEAVFSLTGSPIVPSNVVEHTANVNIPVSDGILSIRPQSMDPTSFDQSLIGRIDQHTYNHLRTLKTNMEILMAGFGRKFKH